MGGGYGSYSRDGFSKLCFPDSIFNGCSRCIAWRSGQSSSASVGKRFRALGEGAAQAGCFCVSCATELFWTCPSLLFSLAHSHVVQQSVARYCMIASSSCYFRAGLAFWNRDQQ